MHQTEFRCDFCQGTEKEVVYTLKDHRLHLPGEWVLYRCPSCGLLCLWPQPDWVELERHYPQPYHGYIRDENSSLKALRHFGFGRRLKAIERFKKPIGSLLEIGCATGDFLAYVSQKLNIHGTGIEPISFAADIARAKGLTIFSEDLPALKFAEQSFDVVAYWDVLEHIPNPLEHLQECYRILQPGGLLVIKTPDPSGGEAGLFKENWIGFEAPQHLFIFSKHVLIRRLEDIGFEVKSTDQIGTDYATFVRSSSIWLESKGLTDLGRIVGRSLSYFVFRVLYGISFAPVRKLGFKSSCTIFACKPILATG